MPQQLHERLAPALNGRDRAIQNILAREPERMSYRLLAAHYELAGLRGLASYYRGLAEDLPAPAPIYPRR